MEKEIRAKLTKERLVFVQLKERVTQEDCQTFVKSLNTSYVVHQVRPLSGFSNKIMVRILIY